MSKLAVAPIVEGHGDEKAVPVLLRRIFSEIVRIPSVDVIKPIRIPRSKLVREFDLLRAVDLAELKLRSFTHARRWILVLFDADDALACELAPRLLAYVHEKRSHLDVSIVLAVREYEAWFVASAESLSQYLELEDNRVPLDPESGGQKKAWLQKRFKGRYTETIEQPALSARIDLDLCRSRAPSFDKLCREVERRAVGLR